MNIFDWHEDKSPEELAKELGISDLAIVENAGKEIVEVIDSLEKEESKNITIEEKTNSPFDSFLGLTEADEMDANKWDIAENWGKFEEGMRVSNNTTGKILKVDRGDGAFPDTDLTIWFNDGTTTNFCDYKDSIEDLFVYADDLKGKPELWDGKARLWDSIFNSEHHWVSEYSISYLERNMRLREIHLWKPKRWNTEKHLLIADINIKDNTIKVKMDWKIEEFDFRRFYKKFDVYIEDFEPVKIRKLGAKWKWTSDYSLGDLETTMWMIKDDHLYEIMDIDWDNIYIRSWNNREKFEWNVSTSLENFSSMQKKYKILKKKSIVKPHNLLWFYENNLKTENLWEGNFDLNEIWLGQRVRHLSGKGGRMTNLEFMNIIIEFTDGTKMEFETFDQFKIEFEIYKLDLTKNRNIEKLDNNIRKQNWKWRKDILLESIKLSPWMRVRKLEQGAILEGEIIEIVDNMLSIDFYTTEIATLSYAQFINEWIEVYSEDMKENFYKNIWIPRHEYNDNSYWHLDYGLKNLKPGMRWRSRSSNNLWIKITKVENDEVTIERCDGVVWIKPLDTFWFWIYDKDL